MIGWRAAAGAVVCLTTVGALAGAAGSPGVDGPASGVARADRVDPPRSFSVLAGGDIMTGYRVRAPAAEAGAPLGLRFDFRPQLAPLRAIVESADLAICHMEIPIGTPGGAFGDVGVSPFGGNTLLAPYEIAAGLASVGFDRCSTASNHANDVGANGIAWTIDALRTHGLTTVGTARTPEESADTIIDVDGVGVAHLAFTTYSNTGRPAGWRLNHTTSAGTIAARVDTMRAAGAEVVIVSLHVSKELTPGPVPDDRALVTALTAATRVDAVIVHGPHVVHPIEWVNGTSVWWSVGNFFTQMGPGSSGKYTSLSTTDGLLARVEFVETSSGAFAASPGAVAICNDTVDRTVRSATAGLGDPALAGRIHAELAGCLARTRGRVPDAG